MERERERGGERGRWRDERGKREERGIYEESVKGRE